MDEQLSRLEAKLMTLDDRLRNAEIAAAEMRGQLAHRPTTWTMVTTLFAAQVAVAIVAGLALWAVPPH